MDRATKPAGLLIAPYGGTLIDLLVKGEERDDFIQRANRLPSVQLSPRSVCDLELLATGAFSPLDRFMGRADYTRTIEEMRLANGMPFPIPMTLPDGARAGHGIALRSPSNELLVLRLVHRPERGGEVHDC